MTLTELHSLAASRAATLSLSYNGALTPTEAWAFCQQNREARIVDVRTRAELDWVGRIPGAIEVEWNSWPGGVLNANFVAQLQGKAAPTQALLFICRSGARSHSAAQAAQQAGFSACYNVLEGFEGDKNADSHRGQTGGWRFAGLPWVQS